MNNHNSSGCLSLFTLFIFTGWLFLQLFLFVGKAAGRLDASWFWVFFLVISVVGLVVILLLVGTVFGLIEKIHECRLDKAISDRLDKMTDEELLELLSEGDEEDDG